jgi:hypothetical protein
VWWLWVLPIRAVVSFYAEHTTIELKALAQVATPFVLETFSQNPSGDILEKRVTAR